MKKIEIKNQINKNFGKSFCLSCKIKPRELMEGEQISRFCSIKCMELYHKKLRKERYCSECTIHIKTNQILCFDDKKNDLCFNCFLKRF